jgi:dephospho-CoA kinase
MIIGLTGTMGSGKGEIVKYLKVKGFEHYVYSDILKEIARQRKIEPTRINLQKLGTQIKKETGSPGILSKKLLKKIKTDKAVVDGIRNADEITELKKAKDVIIIGVTAPQKLRYKRIRKRHRPGDPLTWNEFKKIDNLENRGKTKGQETNKCLKMADRVIINDKSLEKLKENLDKALLL